MEYRERERQTKRESRRQARPAKLNEKKGDRELEREIKTKEVFCSGSEKKRIASGHHHDENERQ